MCIVCSCVGLCDCANGVFVGVLAYVWSFGASLVCMVVSVFVCV